MISVIIPAFNRPQALLQAVRSVISQTGAEFELLVVDDGSVEDLSAAQEAVEESGHKFFCRENNGVAAARNFGAHQAAFSWLAFLDSDDHWLPGKLSSQLDFHLQHPDCQISQCEEIWYRNGQRIVRKQKHAMAQGDAFVRSLELCCISSSSVMLSKNLFQTSGGFDERMRVCEDYDLWIRVTAEHPIGLVQTPLVVKHGGHDDQLSRSEVAMDRFRIFSLLKLLSEKNLSSVQRVAAVSALERKTWVLWQGARKRHLSEESWYEQLLHQLREGAVNVDAEQGDFSNFFGSLFRKSEDLICSGRQ